MADRNSSLGYDMYARLDIDRGGRSSSGAELVVSAIIHRLTVDVLPLIESPNGFEEFGEDVRLWVGQAMSEEQLAAKAAGLGPIIERDPRVEEATLTATIETSRAGMFDFRLAVEAKLKTGEPIDLVLGVSGVTVELLSQGR